MARYDDSFIQRVLDATDIVSLISEHTRLDRNGHSYKGCCPFHSEKTGSFFVDPDKKLYNCFGCHKGGNAFGFVMEMENCDFPRAVEILAERAGIPIPEPQLSQAEQARYKERQKILHANKEAANYYFKALYSQYGEEGLKYLKEKRGLSDEIIKAFGLGYSPMKGNFLIKNLTEKGITESTLEKAGVIVKSSKGNFYDKFFGRVTFPIQDVEGNVIGFGARILDGDGAKYMNTAETVVFHKRTNLFALNKAKKSRRGYIILVEGNMDVVSLHEAGIDNVCASLGTALTPEQCKLLRKYTQDVVLLYDSDSAGIKAAFAAIPLLRDANINIKVLNVPRDKAKDPDEFIKKFGKDAFEELLTTSKGYIEFELETMLKKYNLKETYDRKAFIDEALGRIKEIKDVVDKDSYLSKLSDCAKIDVSLLVKRLSGEQIFDNKKTEVKENTNETNRPQVSIKNELAQKQLISILLNDDKILFNKVKRYLKQGKMETELLNNLLNDIYEVKEQSGTIDMATFLNRYEEPAMQDAVMSIYTIFKTLDTDKRKIQVEKIVKEVINRKIDEAISKINQEFKTAPSEKQMELGMELTKLTKIKPQIIKSNLLDDDKLNEEIKKILEDYDE
ncbi:MAG: DNA primase [Clostridia bacterium]|nr:DNA primase [Clostridia bacterium]